MGKCECGIRNGELGMRNAEFRTEGKGMSDNELLSHFSGA